MNSLTDKGIKKNLLIGCSGSVACVKLEEIIKKLNSNFNIKIILTTNSLFFVTKLIPNLKEFEEEFKVKFYQEEDEWKEWEIIEIKTQLRKWADIMLLCPLSANTLAKITNGICDNLLTCVIRAWDMSRPVYFALAMNTMMYEHFLTEEQKEKLINKFKFSEIPTQIKKLACGDYGDGALASVETIVSYIEKNNNG